ncbi:dockerin type I domain-containing protein [Neorhodopirellula pilleata]|uniref:dockerin type I domain-containing protein n=1 Tax=Neorhodopirellula pilleata TaxID=2714738 RepID=UPI001E302BCA|nr:dockerin type I domain-containing protein [Neorhodopirellula pilleata]
MQVLDERRVLAAITGAVYHDANDSIRRDDDETGLVSRLVYVDQNDNASLDAGERYGLTDSNGNFSIDGLVDGDYWVRVFNGTASQVQTSPTSATHNHDVLAKTGITFAIPIAVHDAGQPNERISPAVFASGSMLQTVAADGTPGSPLDLGANIISVNRLVGGDLLVFSDTESGDRAWKVSDSLDTATPLVDSDLGPTFSSAGVDDLGKGIAIGGASNGDSEVWSVSNDGLTATSVNVPSDSVVTADPTPRVTDGPTRSLISYASQIDDGQGGVIDSLAIHVWSNASASMINADPIHVGGGLEVVAFSDEAGLVVVRGANDLTVHDLDNHLATLYTIEDTGGAVDIDATRGLVVTTSPRSFAPEDTGLRLLDQETGSLVADLAIDLSAVGDLATIALDGKLELVVVAGSAGLAQVNLRRPAAQKVSVSGGVATPVVSFGMRLIGDNSGPSFNNAPVLTTLEDTALLRPAPGILADVRDSENDQFVVIPFGDASVGVVNVSVDGGVTFAPPVDFEGQSEISILVTDGRDSIETILTIEVIGVPDGPTGIAPLAPVPENIPLNDVIAVIDVIDLDLVNNHIINVDDPRFDVINGELIFIGPDAISFEDFENLPLIPLIFTVVDTDAGTSDEYTMSIEITDADDPITDLTPDNATVLENRPGDIIKSLNVVDDDFDQFYEFSVDDDRFEVSFGELKLVDGVALDREAAETIVVNVTVTHADDSFTKAITLTVLDVPETPVGFALTNATVLERKDAAVIGDLTIAGNPAANGHVLTTNDSRFIFVGSTLRLADGVSVERTPGVDTEIQIEVTATPTLGGSAATDQFVITVIENQLPFHNPDYPEDVNGDGDASALDALIIINFLNEFNPGPVGPGDPAMGYDVNGDGQVTALDALLVINELNANGGGTGVVNNEPGGEPIAEDQPDAPPAPAPSPQRIVTNRSVIQDNSFDSLETQSDELVSSAIVEAIANDLVQIDESSADDTETESTDWVLQQGLDLSIKS